MYIIIDDIYAHDYLFDFLLFSFLFTFWRQIIFLFFSSTVLQKAKVSICSFLLTFLFLDLLCSTKNASLGKYSLYLPFFLFF